MRTIVVTSDKLISNKLVILFSVIAVLVCFILIQNNAFAQEATNSGDPVKKYNITFPISTLGNCASLEECKTYCEDETHKEACTNFAKSKGFYKNPQGQSNARSRLVLEKAKVELGCNSDEECKTFCKEDANKEKCREFAKKYKLEPSKKGLSLELLEKAKTALGCDNEESCKALCKEEKNREKCSQFAKSAGLIGGIVKVASGSAGFDQVKQIMEKCVKDPKYCKENATQIEKQLMGQGDEFCRTNPDKCKVFRRLQEASLGGKFTPNSEKAYENANANARFCRENPEKCKNASDSGNIRPPKPRQEDEFNAFGVKPAVQGVSRVPSFFDWLFNVFLK